MAVKLQQMHDLMHDFLVLVLIGRGQVAKWDGQGEPER